MRNHVPSQTKQNSARAPLLPLFCVSVSHWVIWICCIMVWYRWAGPHRGVWWWKGWGSSPEKTDLHSRSGLQTKHNTVITNTALPLTVHFIRNPCLTDQLRRCIIGYCSLCAERMTTEPQDHRYSDIIS